MVNSMNGTDFHKVISYTDNMTELSTYFYQLSRDMKELHNQGYKVSDFDTKKIKYNNGKFEFIVEGLDYDEEDREIEDNIFDMAILYVNTYADKNHLFKPGFVLTEDYIREALSGLKYVFSEEDASYFESLFQNGYVDYYHDYIDKMDKELGGMGNRKGMVKSTVAGALLTDKDDSLNKSAFVSVPVVFIISGILIIIMILIYSLFIA